MGGYVCGKVIIYFHILYWYISKRIVNSITFEFSFPYLLDKYIVNYSYLDPQSPVYLTIVLVLR